MTAPILNPTPEAITRAAKALRAGRLVAMPTETVYGLAARADDPVAVASIYTAKGRPKFNPLIAHCANLEMAQREGDFSANALKLAAAFWPGPLTLVVDLASSHTVCDLARAGLDSIAIRVPAHPVAQALLSEIGQPLVAPSANPSGKISPTEAAHVAADMGEKLELILDGGACQAGVESTIIDARGKAPALLRPGSLDPDQIESVWPGLIRQAQNPNAPQSPGQLLRHYAPNARLRLNADVPHDSEAYLGFGPGPATLNLSPTQDLTEAASNLFSMLRRLDAAHDKIAVAPIPNHGLGEAINDRLTRAAQQ
jgi:L-threonylcarbamoyladenylate synthase